MEASASGNLYLICPQRRLKVDLALLWRRWGDAGATLGRRWGEAEVCWGRLRIYKEENPKAELRETYLKKHWFFDGTCWASAEHPPGIRRVMSANALFYNEFCL